MLPSDISRKLTLYSCFLYLWPWVGVWAYDQGPRGGSWVGGGGVSPLGGRKEGLFTMRNFSIPHLCVVEEGVQGDWGFWKTAKPWLHLLPTPPAPQPFPCMPSSRGPSQTLRWDVPSTAPRETSLAGFKPSIWNSGSSQVPLLQGIWELPKLSQSGNFHSFLPRSDWPSSWEEQLFLTEQKWEGDGYHLPEDFLFWFIISPLILLIAWHLQWPVTFQKWWCLPEAVTQLQRLKNMSENSGGGGETEHFSEWSCANRGQLDLSLPIARISSPYTKMRRFTIECLPGLWLGHKAW